MTIKWNYRGAIASCKKERSRLVNKEECQYIVKAE